MIEEESVEEKIISLEKEIKELREGIETVTRKKDEEHRNHLPDLENQHISKEEILIKRLKEYESAFYKELDAQIQIYKESWTWRIGRLFVGLADFILKLFIPKKKAISDRTTKLKSPVFSGVGEKLVIKDKPFNFEDQVMDKKKINFAVIFDTFTQSCFSPEFNTVCFTPSNWKKVLESIPVSGLFIESAWRGIGDTWKDKIANISGKNQSEVIKLVKWAKNHNIPSIFWNKEDPVHFEHFIEVVKNFDFIFTSDADCVPEYQKHAPKAVVNSLPFAAQPLIHNPVVETERSKSVCFAGTYHSHRYHERKADMDFLLKPSLVYGLEIFDRHFGDTGKTSKNFKFPEIYQAVIKGKLEYNEMVKAYKQYKVFLNVNSVKYSPTMFARRVFEILASGTPVISTYSQGIINILGEGTVFISESETDTVKHLEYLLGNEYNWWKASLNGMRQIMEHHTYLERTKYIFDIIGLESKQITPVKFSVASRISTMDGISYLEKLLRQQSYTCFDVILIITGGEINPDDQMGAIKSLFAPFSVKLIKEDSKTLETEMLTASNSDYIALFHIDKYYGPNYLKDYSIAVKYADPKIMGKKSFYRLGQGDHMIVSDKGFEYQYVIKVPHATSVHRKTDINSAHLREYLNAGDVFDIESGILSIDPFNYLDSELPIRKENFLQTKLDEINL
jgi:spore maturation protein CgeB